MSNYKANGQARKVLFVRAEVHEQVQDLKSALERARGGCWSADSVLQHLLDSYHAAANEARVVKKVAVGNGVVVELTQEDLQKPYVVYDPMTGRKA